jgi:hypothetical protein
MAFCTEIGVAISIAAVISLTLFPCLPARRATLRGIGVAFGLEKLLLFGAKGKGSFAIETLD